MIDRLFDRFSNSAPPQQTYDLTTFGGAVIAIGQTALTMIGALIAFTKAETTADPTRSIIWLAIGIVAVLIVAMWILPVWWFTMLRLSNDRRLEERRIQMTTEKVRLAEIELRRDEERTRSIEVLRGLSSDQIRYGLELHKESLFDIQGNRVTWTVNKVVIPVTFSITWLEKYEARPHDDELPADSDFDGEPHRDQCRVYNGAITDALVALGYVRRAASKYPGRWLYVDESYRWKGLELIGLDKALAIARYLLGEDVPGDEVIDV